MEIRLNKSKSGWIDISEKKDGSLKLRVEHYTRKQYYKLEQIILSCNDIPSFVDETTKKAGFNFKLMTPEQKAKAMSYNKQYMEHLIKYTVKEWKGFVSEGKEIPLLIIDNEMDDQYWNLFMEQLSYEQLEAIYLLIVEEVTFGETELKK